MWIARDESVVIRFQICIFDILNTAQGYETRIATSL
mgnify:CR=1 FL=1